MTLRRPLESRTAAPRRRAAFLSAVEPLEARCLLATYTVTAFGDAAARNPASGDATSTRSDGAITLRSAIQAADATAGPNTIILPAGTYTLSISADTADGPESGDLNITNSLTLTGAGAASTIISVPSDSISDRVLSVSGPGTANVSGVTITGGNVSKSDGNPSRGGGIFVSRSGNLTLADSVVSGNSVNARAEYGGFGGGIYNDGGRLTLNRTTVASNTATGDYGGGGGGGVENAGAGQVTLLNSVVRNNQVREYGGGPGVFGGGIDNQGTLTVTQTTVRDNTAGAEYGGGTNVGGGIYNTGQATFTESTVSGNKALRGGGIASLTGTLVLANSTVSSNTASRDGGGILLFSAETPGTTGSIDGSTIAGNASTDGNGGGISSEFSGTLTIKNTILAGNTSGGNYSQGGQDFGLTSLGHNLSTDGTAASVFKAAGDLNNVANAKLGPLADNGGPTFTQALLTGSPALGVGDPAGAPTTDQRGLPRVVGGTIDIGAFELQAAPLKVTTTSLTSDPDPSTLGQDVTFNATVSTALDEEGAAATGETIAFSVDGKPPTSVAITVVNGYGQATYHTSTLTVGAHTVVASYSGNQEYGASTSSPLTQTVNQAATRTTLTSSHNPSAAGQPVTFTAEVVLPNPIVPDSARARAHTVQARQVVLPAGSPPFAGSVTFLDGTTVLGTAPVHPDGTATLTTSSLSPGRHPITAVFGHDPNYAPSTSPAVAQTVTGVATGPEVVQVRRYGYHLTPTTLVVIFNGPLEPGPAQATSNYRITDSQGRIIPVVAAFYHAATNSVTLYPSTFLDLHRRYTLTVVGSTPGGIKGVAGNPLNSTGAGRPGADFVTVIDAADLVVTNPFASGATAALRLAARVRAADIRAGFIRF